MAYYLAKVEVRIENDRGRIQKVREVYLVDAMSGTEAEAKTYKALEDTVGNFKITSLVESKIIKVIN